MVEAADGPLHLPKMEPIASGRCAVQNMQVDGSACDGYRTALKNPRKTLMLLGTSGTCAGRRA